MIAHEVDQLLRGYGIRPGNKASRLELAEQLAAAGITSSAMERLWKHSRESSKTPASLMAKILADGSWKELVDDLQFYEAKEAERSSKGGSYPSHYGKGTQQTFEDRARANGQTVPELMAERDEQHAAARVLYERRTVDEAAREMAWLPERVFAAIEKWAGYWGVSAEIVLVIREDGSLRSRQKIKTK